MTPMTGDTNFCLTTDQRGVSRSTGARCDIGAYEAVSVVSIVATDPVASESGDSGLFTITRRGETAFPATVSYAISGTAVNGVDYSYFTNAAYIPAGETIATITIAPIYDLLVEGNETVTLTLLVNGYLLGSSTNATVTISDFDDGARKAPVLSAGLAPTARYGRFIMGRAISPAITRSLFR